MDGLATKQARRFAYKAMDLQLPHLTRKEKRKLAREAVKRAKKNG